MTEACIHSRRLPPWVRGLALAFCLLPPTVLAWLLWRNAVNVPYWDEWDDDIAGIFVKWHAGQLSFGDLWAQHNESRLVLPRLIFLLLGGFTHWNLRVEVGFTFFLAALAAAMIFQLGRQTLSENPLAGWTAFFLSSLLLFSPTQYQAWLWGMELVLYLPLVCILAGLLVLRTKLSRRAKILSCGVLATISTYSFSNGLLAWVVLFPAIFLAGGWAGCRRQGRAVLLWLFAFLANVALYFQNYQFPLSSGFWPLLWHHPWQVAEYVCVFLGAPLTDQNGGHQAVMAAIIGGGLLILFGAACAGVFHWRRETALAERVWPWLTLGGYGILSALLAAIGRASFGAEQALAPRYGIFGACLMVAVIYLLPVVAFYRPTKTNSKTAAVKAALAVFGAVVVLLHALAWPAAVVNLQFFHLTLLHGKGCLKFLNALPPQPATTKTLCPDLARIQRMADSLGRAGVWNYSLHSSARLADFPQQPPANGSACGSIEVGQADGTNLFLSGWALAATRHAPADCVVFTCEGAASEPEIFAVMDRRFARFDLAQKFSSRAYLLSGWQKNCALSELPKGALIIKAWAYDVESGRISPLAGEVHLGNK